MEKEMKMQLDRIEKNTLLAAKETLTIEDVAELTGLSKSHIYKLTASRGIPHYKPTGKMIYFDRKEVEGWMKRGKVATAKEIEGRAATYVATRKDRRAAL